MPRKSKVSKAVKSYVAKHIKSDKEVKILHAEASGTQSDSGSNTAMNDIAAGDGLNNREGHEIFMNSCRIQYNVTAGDQTNFMRLVLYSLRNKSGPNIASSVAVNGYIDPDSFIVYKDIRVAVSQEMPKVGTLFHSWKGKGKKVIFDDTTSASQTHGKLLLYLVSDSSAVTHPSISYSAILKYTE